MRHIVSLALLSSALMLASCDDAKPAGAVALMVFAPHPDDEALGCAGIMRQALASGKCVKLVLFTNGDGFPAFAATVVRRAKDQVSVDDFLALARFRQEQTQQAFKALGGKTSDIIFLGYPDSALDQVYQARDGAAVTQRFTQKNATYGLVQADYHTAVHGRAAPYTHAAALADVVELLKNFRPEQICVTHEADAHRDHKAAFWFVRDAVAAANYSGAFNTYLVHGGPEWPWPAGVTPDAPLAAHEVKGMQIPQGVPWPPPLRVPISREANEKKLKAIRAHATHLDFAPPDAFPGKRAYLESFVKAEEVFWPVTRE